MYLFTRYLPFLPPPRPLSSPVMEANLSPADVLWEQFLQCRQQEEQGEGLSITMPIETAAQSPVLHSQIRPPDRAALQLDPTHYNGWGRAETVRDQQL